ncbi:succinate dehydrogenase, hydrophobic membrane anchor protein [Labrys monachus]|uniref:Succinate dehydrogenase hydrophobic membrane anchor subunit n=1 Tax=Labrys monachus TaxID=217067 RepID=A0ABU0FNG7_9HYPH|nr:succinate dehydrogenase, hydrophobic membrane anchor protein [Labrys monachus]MDQ0396161.1 succinate dehydrogenase / fumarate reductase membrane anchor subunit [Labrys monachus]
MSKTPSLKTPLGRVRGLGSARSGTRDFWRQRLTGVAMVPLTVAFVLTVIYLARASQATAIATLSSPLIAILLFLFIVAGIVHMRIGMQVIIEDYVHDETMKIVAVMANTFFSLLVGAACIYALLKLNFGI